MISFFELLFWFFTVLFVYSYCFYPILLMIFAHFFSKPIKVDESYLPNIGVLVPAYNEEKVIEKKIKNILSIDYPPEKLSIWVGSDCSSDATDSIVESFNDPRVHLWRAPSRGGKTGILNRLAPQIDAEIILFTDANTMHRIDCLRSIVRNFSDEKVGGVAGHIEHVVPQTDDESAEFFYRSFESRQKFLEGMLHSSISAFGGFYAIRKNLFQLIPANAYSNDDVLIPMNVIRQGYRIIYEPQAVSEEELTMSVYSEFKRRIRIGAGNFQAFGWLLDFCTARYGWPSFCFLSHKVARWFSPFFFFFAFVSCGVLFFISSTVLYKMMFVAGLVMVIAGLAYKLIPLRITKNVFYFLVMNIALIWGFLRYISGIKSAVWSRTEREL